MPELYVAVFLVGIRLSVHKMVSNNFVEFKTKEHNKGLAEQRVWGG